MKAFFNGMALLIAVTCLVWVAVLWSWQSAEREVSIGDMLMYLGLLPLVMVLLIVMGRWAWAGVSAKRTAHAAAALAAEQSSGSDKSADGVAAEPAGDAAQRHATYPVWLAAVHTAAGATPADVISAAKDGQPRPQLDDELQSAQGMPVMCARVPELDMAVWEGTAPDLIMAARASLGEAGQQLEVDDAVLRALACLDQPVQQALSALMPWASLLKAKADQEHRIHSIHVQLGLPSGWNPLEQGVLSAWLAQQLNIALGAAPTSRPSMRLTLGSGETLWQAVDQTLQMLDQQEAPALVLALAAHSDLSDKALSLLDDQARLFDPQNRPKGHMPSEGAAALLLASKAWPTLPPDTDDPDLKPMAWIHRPAIAQRDKSIDAAGKVQSHTLRATIEQAQRASQLPTEAIAALVADADQHTARGTELFGITLDVLPKLDPTEDMRLIGTVCGGAGSASALSVVATACARAQALGQPVLATCLGDPFMRMSLIVRASTPTPEPA